MKPVSVVFLVALALGACGGRDDHISTAARNRLAPLVQEVRHASESSDSRGATRALAELSRTVTELRRRGAIGEQRAAEILASARQVASQLHLVPTTTTTTTTTSPRRDHGKDNGEKPGRRKHESD